ncbi:hypothetical protein [Geminicoccus flavidas]|uniref:hypothetical protein n=1 Tax=Geminicoccus flavidas TaxID=2506407 RepID=UPI001358C562|nr:hypothetical protein [Geminicoccus flavidas]
MSHVIYVFSDPGLPAACKIGKDENLPSRYKQARCHTPRGIEAAGLFRLGGRAPFSRPSVPPMPCWQHTVAPAT